MAEAAGGRAAEGACVIQLSGHQGLREGMGHSAQDKGGNRKYTCTFLEDALET